MISNVLYTADSFYLEHLSISNKKLGPFGHLSSPQAFSISIFPKVQRDLESIKIELAKSKDDKKIKNECILAHNSSLVKKLQKEHRSKIVLIDEILDYRSALNQMKNPQRIQVLTEMRCSCITELEKLALITERKTSMMKLTEAGVSPRKASFV